MTKQARDLDAGARLRVRQLRGQALSALGALLDGLQGADGTAQHRLLEGDERHVYAGLVATILRIVVVLFAEARGLMPAGGPRSLRELHADLVAGRAAPGAWARMLALFQHLHAAASAGASPHGRRGGLFEDHHARRGGLFDPETYPFLDARTSDPGEAPRVPDAAVLEVLDRLLFVAREPLSYEDLDVEHIGVVHEWLTAFRLERAGSSGGGGDGPGGSRLVLQAGEERRRLGAHYTSRALTRIIVEKTLEPLIRDRPSPDEILALKVCDPAMGSGAFLLEACRQLACRLASAWQETSSAPPPSDAGDRTLHARRLVAQRCLYGVDRNPVAVDLARLSLWLLAKDRDLPFTFVDHALRHGDSLVGLTREQIAGITPGAGGIAQAGEPQDAAAQDAAAQDAAAQGASAQHAAALSRERRAFDATLAAFLAHTDRKARGRALRALPMLARGEVVTGIAPDDLERWIAELHDKHAPFHWQLELTEVFSTERGGFDALLGNPPWVSYAGRAAQPLPDELRDLYAATSPAFHGYRNLQGLFIHRCASMLRPGGRLGLVVPTSMSDLDGYEPSRRAHDALSTCDDDLPDFGKDAFDGVFQPCMALLSTRLGQSRQIAKTGHWPLSRSDLDAETTALLDRLGSRPTFPKHLFGERGFQTIGDDVSRLHELEAPTDELPVALRVGSDVAPFRRRAPGLYCNPAALAGRLRPASAYEAVQVLIRQTARFPMAALSDGLAFRNSVLAGFAEEPWSCGFLVAYLNSTPVRWFHYMRHRDARQGMPQLKIAHLRALPAPPPEGRAALELGRIGRELGVRNRGIRTQEQAAIDALVADALDLDAQDRARIAAWGAAVRG